ncbi:LamG-like jellyroll fold domain-containing protein [Flavobacterium celericrescens]|uniref:T9SS type A sorting domain-containing protein n=1 Tax=Flavobacterium celericrescens TaxID=2709780 RepID=A0ABX0IGI7_9FLAO|nr:LamG-like jellyroll fold domain-containing protein [Flavobacterium celericrescens]NHM04396.1 T9SS type A sorting domain-containing protein [Flavobacterium celericrescens]
MKTKLLFKLKMLTLLSFSFSTQFGLAQQGETLHFDGSDDYVMCGSFLPTSYTKEAWIYISNFNVSNNIISGGNADGQHALFIPNYSGNKLSAGHNGAWEAVQDPNPLIINTWYHVAVTYDAATTTMKLYKNGNLVATNTNVPQVLNGNIIRLGSFDDGANVFNGRMDEVRIWDRVLTTCELQYNKDAELAVGQTGLVAYYKCNQGTANQDNGGEIDLIDSTTNGYDGAIINFQLNGTTSNFVAPGSPANGVSGTLYNSLNVNTSQSFCNAAQVLDLTATGSGTINWYDVATGGTPLTSTQNLATGNYYVSQTTGTCESDRIAVSVVVNITSAPTAPANQTFDANATIANLVATGSNLKWFSQASGGVEYNITDILTTGTYYVSQTDNGCESSRTSVNVTINGGSLHFDDSNDRITLGTAINAVIDPINTITVEAWVYNTSFNNAFGYNLGSIIGNYNTFNVDMQFMLRRDGTAYQFWVNDSNGTNFKAVSVSDLAVLNQWQHVAAVWNGSDLKLYLNGVLVGTTTGVTGASFKSLSSNPIHIGTNLSNEKYTGNIDEIRIWSRALTAPEILNNMNCELGASQTGLVAYYKFNQGFGGGNNTGLTALTDSSGNNYNGALNNFALNGGTSNWSNIAAVTTGNTCSTFLNTTSFDESNLSLYPNPTSGIVNISYDKEISNVSVYNLLGQNVLNQEGKGLEIQLDLSTLASATYFVKITSEGATKTIKVIKQ